MTKPHLKIVHDLRNALSTVQAVEENLRQGYKFDDAKAAAKMAAFAKALKTLEREIPILEEIYLEKKCEE